MKKHQIIQKLLSAFDTHSKGFSARKLSAFAIMACVVLMHVVWLKYAFRTEKFDLLEGILLIDYAFIGTCLGMTTYETVKKLNTKKDETPENNIDPAVPADGGASA